MSELLNVRMKLPSYLNCIRNIDGLIQNATQAHAGLACALCFPQTNVNGHNTYHTNHGTDHVGKIYMYTNYLGQIHR